MTKKNEKSIFAKNLISIRNDMGLSAEEFAEHLEMSYPTLRDIEAGISGGSKTTKKKIAMALNIPLEELERPQARGAVEMALEFAAKITAKDKEIAELKDQKKALETTYPELSRVLNYPKILDRVLSLIRNYEEERGLTPHPKRQSQE